MPPQAFCSANTEHAPNEFCGLGGKRDQYVVRLSPKAGFDSRASLATLASVRISGCETEM